MTSLKDKTDAQIEKTRQAKPEFMQAIDDIMITARKFEQGGSAISIGQQAPNFELSNAQGEHVLLSDLLENGPVVVTFYRGDWCPYCNLQLKALHSRLADIHMLGAELIAISPQMPDASVTKTVLNELQFPVLSDQDASVARQYGVAWEVPDLILEHMRKDRNLDLAVINNGNGNVLPIPATFILDRDGIVLWRYVDVDYRTRGEPSDIITALENAEKNI
jgi:peroxiredoxin